MNKAKNIAICLFLSFASMVASAATTTNVNCFVEYIQSSGTQWINTGVIGKSSVNIAADVTVLNCAGSSCFIGERPSASDKVVRLGIWVGKDYKWALNCGGIDSSQVGAAFLNTRCVVSNENARLWVAPYGGASQRIYNGANQIFSSSLPLTMFFLNTDAGLDQASNRPLSAKVYGLTIYDNGAIVRDFRPCQVTISDTDAGTEVTKYGLWDRVGSRFYGDESGGVDFTAGNVVANDPVVVIASDERGLQGVEAPGSYTVNDTQTFSANDVAVGPLVWSPIGYALEIWDSVNCKWSVLKMVKGSSYTYVRSVESGTVRLRWLWSQTGNVRHYGIGDYIHSQGLFAHFDGVYNAGFNAAHLTSPSTWVNLANGGFNLTRKNDSSFNDDSWVGNKKSYFAANSIHAASALIAKSLTLEMMISSPTPPAKTYAVWAFFGNNANNRQLGVDIRSGDTSHPLVQGIQYRALGKWNSNAAVPNNDNPITKWDTRQYVAVVCDGSTASGYCNGMNLLHSITVPEGDAIFDGNPTLDYFGIGAHNDGTSPALSGSQICAVRMTAGVLEDWQIEHNSAVDNARFAPNIIVVNGEIGETGVKGTSSADGSYNLLSGTFTITASKEEVDRASYYPQVTVEILENGVWNVAEENLFTQSYTIDKDVIGENSVRITWTWESAFQAFAIHPIAEQSHDNGEKCCPQVVVTNAVSGDTWIAGGDIESPYFDVEYTNNEGVGIANVMVIGKGEYAGLALKSTFVITATKLDDENLFVADPSVRRYEVDGAFVYVFTNAASQHVVTAKRNLVMLKYLLAGGGGGGGNSMGGGGGAGGVLINDAVNGAFVTEGDTFSFTVGAGGNGSGAQNTKGSNGGATKLDFASLSLSAFGGGGGGSWKTNPGDSGGSGGGGVQLGAGGTGISGQGFEGAAGLVSNGGESGGGGGAGHAGYTAGNGHAGYGGEGVSNNFTGAWVVYGGGGGAGGSSSGFGTNAAGLGGIGGGGNGGKDVAGENGVDGLGGGGGGGGWNGSLKSGGKGGSGAVVLVLKPNDLTVVIEDQVWESFDPCCPEFVVSNTLTSATWVVGGDVANEYFDVEYSNNIGAGTGNVLIIGKGEFSGVYHSAPFNITATKYEDANIVTTDLSARRLVVDGKSVYVFTNAASAQVVTAKRGIYLTDYLVVGGGGAGGFWGGGGGAGGVTNAAGLAGVYVDKDDAFTLAVGAGGVGCSSASVKGGNGGKTTFAFGLIDVEVPGGGGGGSRSSTAGAAGASGGGSSQNGAGGAGIDGFGYAGAVGGSSSNTGQSGGGGGAGHVGYAAVDGHSGYGGEGVSNNITGAWVVYGGGGGGGGAHQSLYWKYNAGLGGLGGGGNGGKDVAGENGVDGLGGGGGGGGAGYGGTGTTAVSMPGGNGGSGTVIVALVPADFEIEAIPTQYLDAGASECTPEPVVRTSDGVTLLTKDVDYTVSYTGNTQSGYAYLTITGINDYSGKVCEISFKIYRRYFVDDDAAPGGNGSEALPFTAISNAVEKAKTDISGGAMHVEVYVAAGTYTETGFVLDASIVVIGANRDTVNIVDDVAGSRAFTLSHADAVVRNLTISGNGLRVADGQGGHLWMSAGLVENCVIKDGRTSPSSNRGYGGNVWMSGGRLTRCLVMGGKCNWGGWPGSNRYSYGIGIYATGGIIDNCWFKDNKVEDANSASWYGVYLNGAVSFVNCTVTGGASRNKGEGVGVYVASANATVVNCVFCDNGDNSADANFGKANLNRFFNCAAPVTNASCATWKVLTSDDFAEYATGDYMPIPGSQLVDAGDAAYCQEKMPLDLDGNARVSGASVDIGCWELGQLQFSCGGYPSSYAVLENANVTFHATAVGPASDVVFRWNYGNGTIENTREAAHVYAYPAAGYFTVKLAASSDGGSTWTDWYTVPTRVVVAPERMYVDSNCATPAYPYKTRETAATTLAAVLTSLTNNVSVNKTCVDGVDVMILSGSVLNDTGHLIGSAVTVRGETSDPADVEIVDNTVGFRAFMLSHPDAVVSNLTISGNGLRIHSGAGGHVWMSAGLVANCVIKDGNASPAQGRLGNGGNVWMSGGRLERCLVTGGKCSSGGWPGSNSSSYGMALYATGGTIESCFFKDNKVPDTNSDSHGGVYLYGAVRLLNCTITGGESFRDANGTGVRVASANATVVNCVLYGNGDNSAGANFGTSNLNRFFYCGSSVTNESCATWTVLTDADFVDYAGGNLRQKRNSQLINRGTLDPAYFPEGVSPYDLSGNIRVEQRAIDLGCWEVLSSIGSFIIVR